MSIKSESVILVYLVCCYMYIVGMYMKSSILCVTRHHVQCMVNACTTPAFAYDVYRFFVQFFELLTEGACCETVFSVIEATE